MSIIYISGIEHQAGRTSAASSFSCTYVTEIPFNECKALEALYINTNGSSWTNSNGWLDTKTPCQWYGVQCSIFGRIRFIFLNDNNLVGSIPPELGNLIDPQRISLTDNKLTGEIPHELGSLTSLEWLLVSNNRLSGSIPKELGKLTSLESLTLSSNNLSGPIPQEFINLSSLQVFLFENTSLCEPQDDLFQTWLNNIGFFKSTNVLCKNQKQPIVLVHGWNGLGFSEISCDTNNLLDDADIIKYSDYVEDGSFDAGVNYWGDDFPSWLEEDYEVWVSKLTSGFLQGTPSIHVNSFCLVNQIEQVATATNRNDIVIIAHSMGGLVTRSCLSFPSCSENVDKVITLGTPHQGIPFRGIITDYLCSTNQKAACEMGNSEVIDRLNSQLINLPSNEVDYFFIGGEVFSGYHPPLLVSTKFNGERNDGLVGYYSSIGQKWGESITTTPSWWNNNSPDQLWTLETHSNAYSDESWLPLTSPFYPYYKYVGTSNLRSVSYDCVHLWISESRLCVQGTVPSASHNPNRQPQLENSYQSILTSQISVTSGVTNNLTIVLEENQNMRFDFFGLADFQVTLTSPTGSIVSPDSSQLDPDVSFFKQQTGYGLISSYTITGTTAGLWQINFDVTENTDIASIISVESDEKLELHMRTLLIVEEPVTISANLSDLTGGIENATLIAKIDDVELSFSEVGNGIYSANFIPTEVGSELVIVTAIWEDGQTSNKRQSDVFVTIEKPLSLTYLPILFR
ncbi:MAG: hypothetical protein AAF902_10015 [Chloroflexota bacterium]